MCYQQVLCMPPFHFRYDEKNKQFNIHHPVEQPFCFVAAARPESVSV